MLSNIVTSIWKENLRNKWYGSSSPFNVKYNATLQPYQELKSISGNVKYNSKFLELANPKDTDSLQSQSGFYF